MTLINLSGGLKNGRFYSTAFWWEILLFEHHPAFQLKGADFSIFHIDCAMIDRAMLLLYYFVVFGSCVYTGAALKISGVA